MTRAKLLTLLISICIVFSLFGNSNADSAKEDYELKERCGKHAWEYFKKEYGNGMLSFDENVIISARYINHYNKKLNKCIVLVTTKSMPKTSKEVRTFIDKTLLDITELKQYGQFTKLSTGIQPNQCEVSGRHCSSEIEWDSLVKPYLEE